MVQAESFDREIKYPMSKKRMVPNFSSISQLDLFLDSDNIIRVGGRLRISSLTEAEQHPVIFFQKRVQYLTQSSNGVTLVSHMVQED